MGPHSELWLWEPASAQSGQYNNAVLTGAFVRGQGLAVRGEAVAIDPDEPEVTPETSQTVNQWVNTLSVQPR